MRGRSFDAAIEYLKAKTIRMLTAKRVFARDSNEADIIYEKLSARPN